MAKASRCYPRRLQFSYDGEGLGLRIFICLCLVATYISAFILPDRVNAKQLWQIKQQDASKFPLVIVPDKRAISINGLPDGKITSGKETSAINKAWYTQPTKRYGHGILGDSVEGGALVVATMNGSTIKYELPITEVFEDITPRLADLDGDGITEIITIISSIKLGASLGIFQLKNNILKRQAQSPYIGQAYRWLNIAGIADYKGNSTLQIAIVVTPHIGGRLDLFEFDGRRLKRITSSQGFSNHIIGSREQRLSASYLSKDGRRMILALPSANRKALKIMSFESNDWLQLGDVNLPSSINKAILVKGQGDNVEFTLGLSDGTVFSVTQ